MLTINRLRLDCRTARDHPSPTEMSGRLHRIARHHVAAELAKRLETTTVPADQRVMLIRQLRVQLELDASLDESVLAKAFASAIAAGIQAAKHDGDVVITYADDVEQIARLLIDLAAGTEWGWRHRRAFPGLAHLPPTAAIRTVALESPLRFLDATARMTMRSLQLLTAALEDADADAIASALPSTEASAPADPAVATAVCTLWLDCPAVRTDQLLLLLATRLRAASASIGQIRQAARAVHALAATIDAHRANVDAALIGVDDSTLERIRAQIAVPTPRPAVRTSSTDAVTWTTPFGALFLLLPYIVEAGVLTAHAEQRRGIASALAGPDTLDDPAVVALLALNETRRFAAPREPLETSTLDWLMAVNAVGPVRPRVGTARIGGRRISVVVDGPTGHWLAVTSGAGTAAAVRPITDRFGSVDAHRPTGLTTELRRLGALDRAALGDCMTASNLIRRVANSLPGFATATSAHIWREALDAAAAVTVTASGWQVRVERSPLAEILRICGHGDRTTVVPWLDNMAVRVVIAP